MGSNEFVVNVVQVTLDGGPPPAGTELVLHCTSSPSEVVRLRPTGEARLKGAGYLVLNLAIPLTSRLEEIMNHEGCGVLSRRDAQEGGGFVVDLVAPHRADNLKLPLHPASGYRVTLHISGGSPLLMEPGPGWPTYQEITYLYTEARDGEHPPGSVPGEKIWLAYSDPSDHVTYTTCWVGDFAVPMWLSYLMAAEDLTFRPEELLTCLDLAAEVLGAEVTAHDPGLWFATAISLVTPCFPYARDIYHYRGKAILAELPQILTLTGSGDCEDLAAMAASAYLSMLRLSPPEDFSHAKALVSAQRFLTRSYRQPHLTILASTTEKNRGHCVAMVFPSDEGVRMGLRPLVLDGVHPKISADIPGHDRARIDLAIDFSSLINWDFRISFTCSKDSFSGTAFEVVAMMSTSGELIMPKGHPQIGALTRLPAGRILTREQVFEAFPHWRETALHWVGLLAAPNPILSSGGSGGFTRILGRPPAGEPFLLNITCPLSAAADIRTLAMNIETRRHCHMVVHRVFERYLLITVYTKKGVKEQ
jgi:hypothetical protein